MRKSLVVTTVVSVLASLLLLAPSSSATSILAITLTSSETFVYLDDEVVLTGTVNAEPTSPTRVQLQKRFNGVWNVLDEAVIIDRQAQFTSIATKRKNKYRLIIIRNASVARSKSNVITVYASEPVPEEPQNPDDPTDPGSENPTDPGTDPENPEEPATPSLNDYSVEQLRSDASILLNDARRARGSESLVMTSALNAYAQAWSDTQYEDGQLMERSAWYDQPESVTVTAEFVTINNMPKDAVDFFIYQDEAKLAGAYRYVGIGIAVLDSDTAYYTFTLAQDKATEPPVTWNETTVRDLILQKTNEFRAQNGLAPLQLMPELSSVAQNWANYMASSNQFYHNPDYYRQYPAGWKRAGENIAAGQTPEEVVNAWINSAGHRANLLGDYTHIGIGYGYNNNSTYKRYYVQNFAKY